MSADDGEIVNIPLSQESPKVVNEQTIHDIGIGNHQAKNFTENKTVGERVYEAEENIEILKQLINLNSEQQNQLLDRIEKLEDNRLSHREISEIVISVISEEDNLSDSDIDYYIEQTTSEKIDKKMRDKRYLYENTALFEALQDEADINENTISRIHESISDLTSLQKTIASSRKDRLLAEGWSTLLVGTGIILSSFVLWNSREILFSSMFGTIASLVILLIGLLTAGASILTLIQYD